MDSLIFLPDMKAARQVESQEPKKEASIEEPEVDVEVENVERPVDLYKVKRVSLPEKVYANSI